MRNAIREATIGAGAAGVARRLRGQRAAGCGDHRPMAWCACSPNRWTPLYVLPGVSLARYKRVMLDSVELAFKPTGRTRHPEVSDERHDAHPLAGRRRCSTKSFPSALTMQQWLSAHDAARVPTCCACPQRSPNWMFAATPGTAGAQRMHLVSPSDLTLLMELRDSHERRVAGACHRQARRAARPAISGSRVPCRIPPRRARAGNVGWPAACARSMVPAARRTRRSEDPVRITQLPAEGT